MKKLTLLFLILLSYNLFAQISDQYYSQQWN
ncbi:hypothetical protein MNBD_IGNAVI01-894 [hydrothermal vent metagenome]|uniref:Uncharacterized protein n=1 Tax=hydrothermal vent metagenome TaxID=652676 RepID=A0A3B1C9A8_9ZZZZ